MGQKALLVAESGLDWSRRDPGRLREEALRGKASELGLQGDLQLLTCSRTGSFFH